jgi:hypothetical protein
VHEPLDILDIAGIDASCFDFNQRFAIPRLRRRDFFDLEEFGITELADDNSTHQSSGATINR